jgi:hypothetical protein
MKGDLPIGDVSCVEDCAHRGQKQTRSMLEDTECQVPSVPCHGVWSLFASAPALQIANCAPRPSSIPCLPCLPFTAHGFSHSNYSSDTEPLFRCHIYTYFPLRRTLDTSIPLSYFCSPTTLGLAVWTLQAPLCRTNPWDCRAPTPTTQAGQGVVISKINL